MRLSRSVAAFFVFLLTLGGVHSQSPPITDDDWESLEALTSGQLWALPVLKNTLYAVGDGIEGSGIFNDLLEWTGTKWTLPGGAPIYPPAAHPYYLGSDEDSIYFGNGLFEFGPMGMTWVNYILAWNGSYWADTTLGKLFLPPYISAIQEYRGSYVMAGSFTIPVGYLAARTQINGIVSYDPLGFGVDGPVNLIQAVGTNLYVAGLFNNAGGRPAHHVAVWNGKDWNSFGAGFSDVPLTMAISGSDVYLASKDSVSRWDGAAWTNLGGGFAGGGNQPGIYAMTASGKDLFVGGGFSAAGTTPATNIARWDGTAWSALGSGVQSTHRDPLDGRVPVSALTVFGDYLYVGGDFDHAGNKASVGWARVNLAEPKRLLNRPVLIPPHSIGFTFDNGVVGQSYRIQTAHSLLSPTWMDTTNFVFTQPVQLTIPLSTNEAEVFFRSVSP